MSGKEPTQQRKRIEMTGRVQFSIGHLYIMTAIRSFGNSPFSTHDLNEQCKNIKTTENKFSSTGRFLNSLKKLGAVISIKKTQLATSTTWKTTPSFIEVYNHVCGKLLGEKNIYTTLPYKKTTDTDKIRNYKRRTPKINEIAEPLSPAVGLETKEVTRPALPFKHEKPKTFELSSIQALNQIMTDWFKRELEEVILDEAIKKGTVQRTPKFAPLGGTELQEKVDIIENQVVILNKKMDILLKEFDVEIPNEN